MRRVAEYPQRKDQDVTEADVREDLEKAEEIVKLAEKLIGELPPF
jgi:HEPN domain-containing protein